VPATSAALSLVACKASVRSPAPDDPVFATASGRPIDVPNIHKRVFAKAVERPPATFPCRRA
jgi:hypothetical protein